jgi:hypothetical protein
MSTHPIRFNDRGEVAPYVSLLRLHSFEPYHRAEWVSLSVWCSELSSGIYCRVKWLSTDFSDVRTASIIRDESDDGGNTYLWNVGRQLFHTHPWWRQYAPLKRRSTIILHSSLMEAVRTSETSVDNYFTRQYIPEDNSEHHTRRVRTWNLTSLRLSVPWQQNNCYLP